MIINDRSVVAADGTHVAYGIRGSGPPLALTNGLSTSVFFWKHLYPEWIRRFTVITWDFKGHGASEPARTPGGVTMPALADDLRRILDDAGVDRAIMVGFSMGCQVILEAYRAYPERVSALVPILGPFERVFDTALGPLGRVLKHLVRRTPTPIFSASARTFGQVARLPLTVPLGRSLRLIGPEASEADMRLFTEHLRRVDPPTLAAMALAAQAHSAADLLPQIEVPTLIVAGDADVFAPTRLVGEPMHRRIPGSELLRLPRGTHTSLFEHPREIGEAFAAFVDRHGLLEAV
ncbi:MAG: alpha/beta hydrolase [Myxococcales bacterium]|nr:alpha/beta hydrolase [Myxococcales bacterium]